MESVNRILWVDDDVKRLELSVDIDEFTDRGFVITKAENPDEFNEIIAGRQDFQCIIVDISMPTGKTYKLWRSQRWYENWINCIAANCRK